MSTHPPRPGETGPELQSLEADESVPPRPEEDVADARDTVNHPHAHAEQRTHPDDVVGALSALTERSGTGQEHDVAEALYSKQAPHRQHMSKPQPYPSSPAPVDGGPDSPTADLADPDYSLPDYPDDVDRTDGQN